MSEAREAMGRLRAELNQVVRGQDSVVSGLVLCLLVRGHAYLEGVPGTAKTLLARTLAAALGVDMARVQFTPDLMPGDITGSVIYDDRTGEFRLQQGPVFTNILLGDEINRTPPKTQAALLEAMAEHQVSVDGTTYRLGEPFLVIATANPIEFQGTYPLPEAQLDRFTMRLHTTLPPRGTEVDVVAAHLDGFDPNELDAVARVMTPQDLAAAWAEISAVLVDPAIVGYCVDLAAATRSAAGVRLGASARGSINLAQVARAWAWLVGRDYVTPDDVKTMAVPVLAHRISLRPEAELDGLTASEIVTGATRNVPVPR